jgi:hypothetical protein
VGSTMALLRGEAEPPAGRDRGRLRPQRRGGDARPAATGATPVVLRAADVTALGQTAGNRAVAGHLGLAVQRSPESEIATALDAKIPIVRPDGDVKKAWGVLNGLDMTGMLQTLDKVDAMGRLGVMTARMKDASGFNVPRLNVAVTAQRLRKSGRTDDPGELNALAAQIALAGIGGQVAEVEVYLRLPAAALADPRAGVTEPDPSKIGDIRSALEPAAAGAAPGTTVAWDGAGTDITAAKNRKALRIELLTAMTEHLRARMPGIRKIGKAPKLPMTAFEGAGKQAKRVVDAALGGVASGGVLTPGQASTRAAFNFTAGVNLVDLTDPANYTPKPEDVADWISATDPRAHAAAKAHHFQPNRSSAEENFLDTEVIAPFVATNQKNLELYDVLGFAITLEPGKVAIQPHVTGNMKPPKGGGPPPAERARRWVEWETLVHEYIHTLEHSAFGEASQGRRVMKEGFCEFFTKEVLTAEIPKAQAGDPTLQAGVEGTDPAGKPWPGFSKALVPDYHPGSYAAYLAEAEKIAAATSREAMRAAFFQGHVELIGLAPDGSMAPAVAPGSGEEVAPPPGVTTVFTLAVILNSSSAGILAANPGLKATSPLPATVRVPGVRHHTLVAAREFRPTGGVMAEKVEGPTEIAAMHGVTPDAITRANPGKDWSKAKGGERVLVPAH